MKTKKEKMERENRQWGLRLWSKTNLTFGKGFEAQIIAHDIFKSV